MLYGTEEVEVGAVEQLVERGQLRAIAQAMVQLYERGPKQATPARVCDWVAQELADHGLDALEGEPTGDLAWFRPLELSAVINRLRSLELESAPPSVAPFGGL